MLSFSWMDRDLHKLYQRWQPRWKLFEPSPDFWVRLGTGEIRDLTRATYELGQHLNLATIPQAEYTWGLLMAPEHAGTIQGSGTIRSLIRIPFAYVGTPYAVGAILAHELAHQHLAEERLSYTDELENEKLTDLASIANGLGKLVLAGLSRQAQPNPVEQTSFGYITSDEKYYAYRVVSEQRNLSRAQMFANLPADVVEHVKEFLL